MNRFYLLRLLLALLVVNLLAMVSNFPEIYAAEPNDELTDLLPPEAIAEIGQYGDAAILRNDEQGHFRDVVVATIVYAGQQTVWRRIVDPVLFTREIPDIYLESHAETIDEESLRVSQRFKLKFPPFDYEPAWTLLYETNEPHSLDFRVVEGDLPDSRGRWEIIPLGNGESCIVYLNLRLDLMNLGFLARSFLKIVPDFAGPPHSTLARRMLNAVKWEAERIESGRAVPFKVFKGFDEIDVQIERLFDHELCLLSETLQGYPGPAICGVTVSAPISEVWQVLLDFDNYENILGRISAELVTPGENGGQIEMGFNFRVFYLLSASLETLSDCKWNSVDSTLACFEIEGELAGSRGGFFLYPVQRGQATLMITDRYYNIEKSRLRRIPTFERRGKSDLMVNQFAAQVWLRIFRSAIDKTPLKLPAGLE